MATDHDKEREILILCEDKLQPLYALQIANLELDQPIAFHFVNRPETFTQHCLKTSPLVGLVDLASIIRGKTELMNKLFEFRVVWPVLRSKVGSDGNGQVMRVTPPLKGDFQESLIEMASGASQWCALDETRGHLRSVVRCRGLIRSANGDGDNQKVSVQNISRAGCLLLASDPPAAGSKIEIEIRDLPTGTARIPARVAWAWRWEDTTEIPRAGLEFLEEQRPEEFLEALANPDFFSELS